ncbi:MAG: fibronectin type III domain-containing protein [Thermoplasmata archaeon]
MKWSNLWHLGIVAMLVSVAVSVVDADTPNIVRGYEESQDFVLSIAGEMDFPSLYGYGNCVCHVYTIVDTNGSACIRVTQVDISLNAIKNFSAGVVEQVNITEGTFAPAISFHNNSIYVCWAEKGAIVLSMFEGENLTGICRIENIADYYNPPTLASFGKKLMIVFLCGNQTDSANLVVANRDENGSLNVEVLDTLPLHAQSFRNPICWYDIYGNSHVMLANLSSVEHYYSNGTVWHHEKLSVRFTLASEVNARFVNNKCYIGFFGIIGQDMNAVIGTGEIASNGSIGEIETLVLSTFNTSSLTDSPSNPRVYIAPSGTKTFYISWSEGNFLGNLTGKVGRIVGDELASIVSVSSGKICGVFAELHTLHLLVIENGLLHYKIYTIHKEPIFLSIINTTQTSITLCWSPCYDEEFAWYEIHYSTGSNFTPSLVTLYATIYDNEQTMECIENLELGKMFWFLIVVRFITNETIYSNFASWETPAPVEQVNATVSNVGSDSFSLSWEQKHCKNFEVHFSTNSDFSDEIILELENTTTSYTFDSLNASTTYFVFVRSIGFYGDQADSQVITVLTRPEILDAVANVDEITIRWQKPSNNFFEKMEVYVSKMENTTFDTCSLATVIYDSSISSFTMKFEEMNTSFYFGIVVYNTFWQSAQSNIVSNSTYLPVIPGVSITKYEILNVTSVKIYFPATDYSYFSRLEVHLSLEKNFTPSEKTLLHTIYTQGETAYVIYGLTPDVDYYVRIVLVDNFGQKSISEQLKVRTTTSIECEHPEPEVPFYLYGFLLIIFFLSSTISGLYINAIQRRK